MQSSPASHPRAFTSSPKETLYPLAATPQSPTPTPTLTLTATSPMHLPVVDISYK